ncbi:uncharacterized protein METZ01_LOCUS387916, partial [marine metagenome]
MGSRGFVEAINLFFTDRPFPKPFVLPLILSGT